MTRTTLLAAVVASTVALATSPRADPFEVAREHCEAIGVDIYCMQVSPTKPVTLGQIIEVFRKNIGINFSVERTIRDNNWQGQVDGNTILYPGRVYVFIAS